MTQTRDSLTIAADAEADRLDDMYLLFNVAGQAYGIEVRYVLQIVGMRTIHEMPDAPQGTEGYINLRGNVIPVVNMRSYLGKPGAEHSERTCIIVITVDEKEVGLIVDSIQETLTVEAGRVVPIPRVGGARSAPYMKGVALIANDNTAMLFDAPMLFAS